MTKYKQRLYDELISRLNQIRVVAYSDDLPAVDTFINETIECLDKLIDSYEKGVKDEH